MAMGVKNYRIQYLYQKYNDMDNAKFLELIKRSRPASLLYLGRVALRYGLTHIEGPVWKGLVFIHSYDVGENLLIIKEINTNYVISAL